VIYLTSEVPFMPILELKKCLVYNPCKYCKNYDKCNLAGIRDLMHKECKSFQKKVLWNHDFDQAKRYFMQHEFDFNPKTDLPLWPLFRIEILNIKRKVPSQAIIEFRVQINPNGGCYSFTGIVFGEVPISYGEGKAKLEYQSNWGIPWKIKSFEAIKD